MIVNIDCIYNVFHLKIALCYKMLFKRLPPVIQSIILDRLDPQSLINIMSIDKELAPLIREKLFNYLLKRGLRQIIVGNQPERLADWKRSVYDVIPPGDKRRKVIIAALFYLLGRYPKSNVEEYVYVFNSIINTEFMLYKCLGLSHQINYTFPFHDCFRDNIFQEAQEDELINDKLFEEITGVKERVMELEPQIESIK